MQLALIQNHSELCRLLAIRAEALSKEHNGTTEAYKAATKTDKAMVFMVHMIHMYWRAERRAEKYGYIGVGTISFAERFMAEFQARVLRKIGGAQ